MRRKRTEGSRALGAERDMLIERSEDDFITYLANKIGCDISDLDRLVEIAVRRAKL